MPDDTTFTPVPTTAPHTRTSDYLLMSGTAGNAQLGVYQRLSTRAGGEVVSSDSY
jgi:hypothetical protein